MLKLKMDAEMENRIIKKIKKITFNLKKNEATSFCPALDAQRQYVIQYLIEKIHDTDKTANVNSASSYCTIAS
ncbi:MAG: hypothetical protein QCH99_07950 [Candidatus Bathyarchaeota archaeon]|nr:hypothetical protein [Candidatus Bathyarchaeum tardum]